VALALCYFNFFSRAPVFLLVFFLTGVLADRCCTPSVSAVGGSQPGDGMKAIKHLYIYFQDGQRLALRFPQQAGEPAQIARLLRMQLESPFISIEVDGDLLLIPRDSIKYLQVCPAPPSIPETTITGAQIID
jgi:hypothetical protein